MLQQKPPHLRGVPDALAERLGADQRRELADLHTDLERRRRERAARMEVPAFLADLPRAAAVLYLALPEEGEPFDAGAAVELGTVFGMTGPEAAGALQALRLAELVAEVGGASASGELVKVGPGGVPF